jgi:hypothetical protein
MSAEDDSVVVIDCQDEGWDNVLYENLARKKPVEPRNLHPSYEDYMKQLAHHYSMAYVGHVAENRGEFKRRLFGDHDGGGSSELIT